MDSSQSSNKKDAEKKDILPVEKKDVSTAILDKKKAPNRLICEEALQDDNTVI